MPRFANEGGQDKKPPDGKPGAPKPIIAVRAAMGKAAGEKVSLSDIDSMSRQDPIYAKHTSLAILLALVVAFVVAAVRASDNILERCLVPSL